MSSRIARTRLSAGLVAAVALAGLAAAPADAAPAPAQRATTTATTTTDAPKGYLVKTLPDLDTATDTTPAGSIIIAPGAKTVHVGKRTIHLGFVIHFKTGGPVTYGVQERIGTKWYDVMTMTKTDPLNDCAMGGPGWMAPAPAPGTVRIRGISRQDGHVLVTPSYQVTIIK